MKNTRVYTTIFALIFSLVSVAQSAPPTPPASAAPATPSTAPKKEVSADDPVNGNPMSGRVTRPVTKVDPGSGGRKEENREFEKKEQTWEPTDDKSLLKSIDYPELQVVPRASERLALEAQQESASLIGPYWPIQLSSLALLMSASGGNGKFITENPTDAQKEENALASQTGTMVAGLWLGTTFYLQYIHSYSRALVDVKKSSGKDKKGELLRERLAEEALERPAKLAKTMTNLAVWSHFLAAAYIAGQSEQGTPDMAGIALGMAFVPYFFENRFVSNWEKHQEYKRKIYAPVVDVNFFKDSKTGQLAPMMALRWDF